MKERLPNPDDVIQVEETKILSCGYKLTYPKLYKLPNKMKGETIKNLTDEEVEIILTLKADTTRTKRFFGPRNQMGLVLGLKKKGFIKADTINGKAYFYCLTPLSEWLISKRLI